MSNSITKNKPINPEPYEENCVNFNKNEISKLSFIKQLCLDFSQQNNCIELFIFS